ncbi:MAG: hypothetical protein J5806_00945 [Lentisphaeria bacterium]|nr:hypothetical protein [Lentisphaeria bacterium]
MNSHMKRVLVGGLVAVLVLTALFILVPKTPLVIAGYCFGLLAVVELFGSLLLVAGGSRSAYVTNAAFPMVTYGYAISNLVFSVIIAAVEYFGLWSMPVGWFIFIHIIFAAVLIWRLLAMRSGQEIIEQTGEVVRKKVTNWKRIGAEVEALKGEAPEACRTSLQNVIDAIRYADPMTHPELEDLDAEIRGLVGRLAAELGESKADAAAGTCRELCRKIKARNTQMKMLK